MLLNTHGMTHNKYKLDIKVLINILFLLIIAYRPSTKLKGSEKNQDICLSNNFLIRGYCGMDLEQLISLVFCQVFIYK